VLAVDGHHRRAVCYRIDPRRTQDAAKRLLGENFGGFVTSDGSMRREKTRA
jgi:hypothetical protein